MFGYCIFVMLCFRLGIRAHPVKYDLSSEERQELLNVHNLYRRDATLRFGAANMQELEWSNHLESMASQHAIECFITGEEISSPNYDSVGENLALQITHDTVATEAESINLTKLVGYWYSQYIYYHITGNICTTGCSQFLQMVWAKTFAIGCGASICDEIYPHAFFLCCNYAPMADTSLMTQPFILGSACSECPDDKTRCYNGLCSSVDEDTAMMGSDPHFSVLLQSGSLLCYTVQGKRDSIFNLISNEHLEMNALFVPDPNPEDKVRTWLGQIGITVKGDIKHIQLVFTAASGDIMVNRRVSISSSTVEKLSFRTGKLVMVGTKWTKPHPKVYIEYDDAGLHFSIVFVNDHHLDLVWHSISKTTGKNGGIVGQFLDRDIEIDEDKQLLMIPGQEPIAVVKRHVWKFVKRNLESYDHEDDDHFCWTTIHPSNQGKGVIKGSFVDYEVEDILSA